jgi:hypothetical protein
MAAAAQRFLDQVATGDGAPDKRIGRLAQQRGVDRTGRDVAAESGTAARTELH